MKATRKKAMLIATMLAVVAICACMLRPAARASEQIPGGATQAIVAATNQFLNTLNADQQAAVQFEFSPQPAATAAKFAGGMNGRMTFVGEKYGQSVWSNYPVSDVPRPGLALGSLNAAQRAAVMSLLQVALSSKGFQKVTDIMGADQVLADGGTHYASGTACYTIGIFGKPSMTTPWMLQFGGHHLGLNIVMAGERGVMTPMYRDPTNDYGRGMSGK